MRARDAYRVVVGRSGHAPSLLAGPDRVDQVEVVDIAEGESVLFWDLAPRDATRVARALRDDLNALDAATFLARWSAVADPTKTPPR